ncbi:hypothetical protein DBA20_02660 [Pandoraea capi]|nr:hypothetical protein [Pandoraea sp. LA3]MDN4581888.1 hypothetical protein [Pandoraea capi]
MSVQSQLPPATKGDPKRKKHLFSVNVKQGSGFVGQMYVLRAVWCRCFLKSPLGRVAADLPPTNRASRSLVKFVFGEEDEHEEAIYGTANHRVSEGS